MKTLKKILCLILAVVMAVGVLVLPASAATTDFHDEASINPNYLEAVSVLNELEVLEGGTDGNFSPKGNLTRAEAATIAARVVIGPDAVEGLPKGATKFSDVGADHWASGAIGYANNVGIISGNPDGSFSPNGLLTSYQFAKMLLIAMGINGDYTGTYWATNVYVKARESGLFNGLDELKSDIVLTREQAAQMAMNAIIVTRQVTVWDANLQAWVTDTGANVVRSPLINIVFHLHDFANTDAYGRPVIDWARYTMSGNNYVPGDVLVTVPVEADATFENVTRTGKDLGLGNATYELYENGEFSKEIDKNTKDIGGLGSVIEVYKDYNRVVEIDTYAAKLNPADIVKAKGETPAHIVLPNPDKKGDDLTYNTTEFGKNDVVLYTVGRDDTVVTVELADALYGTTTATALSASPAYIRVNGDALYASKHTAGTFTLDDAPAAGLAGNYYTDAYNNLVYAEVSKGDDTPVNYSYVYVLDIAATVTTTGGDGLFQDGNSVARAQAKIIDLETGELKVVERAVVYDKGWFYADEDGKATNKKVETIKESDKQADYEGKIYSYVLVDDAYVLVAPFDTTNVTLAHGNAAVGSKYATRNTAITTISLHPDKDGATITKATGYASFPDGARDVITFGKDSVVSSMFILVQETKDTTVPVNYAIYVGEGETTASGAKHAFYHEGEIVEYYSDVEFTAEDIGTVYNLTLDGSKVTKAATIPAAQTKSGVLEIVDEGYVKLADESHLHYLASNCQIVLNLKDADPEAGELAEGYTVTLYSSNKTNIEDSGATIDLIVITAVPEE